MTNVTNATDGAHAAPDPRRWFALAIIAISQLMIVVDASIVNIALPSAQRSLDISNANRQWVITAYTLAFGGLLLLGGRIADYAGRKRIFIVGLIGFALSSALGGLAPDAALLFAARALQGGFAALMAPAALALLTVTFTEPNERAKAFGVYGAIAGGGAAVGLVLGGVLTEYASWRWCLLVNTPIALIAAVLASAELTESRATGNTSYDIPGTIAVTGGLVSLVYGFTEAASHGWTSTTTLVCLAVAAVLLVAFVGIESRSSQPLLPMRIFTERNRGGAFLTSFLVGVALFGMFLFLTYYMQGTLHYSALKTGFAFLPFSGGIILGAGVLGSQLPRTGPRLMMGAGLVISVAGLAWLTQIGVHSSWALHVLPSEIVMSVGLGMVFSALTNVALVGVEPHDAGAASALVNATQQVGGSLGTALLNTVATSATASYLVSHAHDTVHAAVHGYVVAFLVSAALMCLAVVATLVLITARKDDLVGEMGAVAVPA